MAKVTFLVRGSVRGKVSSNHRTLSGAVRSMLRDRRSCGRLGGGSYSDAEVYAQIDGTIHHIPIYENEDGGWFVNGSYALETLLRLHIPRARK
jgi:hypothetical protein